MHFEIASIASLSMDSSSWLEELSFTASLSSEVLDELNVLNSIYQSTETDAAPLALYIPSSPSSRPSAPTRPGQFPTLRLVLTTNTESIPAYELQLVLSLRADYPLSAPSLQLSQKYIGPHLIPTNLFSSVLRCYMHEHIEGVGEGIEWREGEVCCWEGIEWTRAEVGKWVEEKEKESGERERVMRGGHGVYKIDPFELSDIQDQLEGIDPEEDWEGVAQVARERRIWDEIPREVETVCPAIISSPPLFDRKSVRGPPF